MKGTEITPKVREKVYERDSFEGAPCCILCGRPYPEVHHVISRGAGGKGIEQNLVCLCYRCHKRYHATGDKGMKKAMIDYLKKYYPEWEESEMK